MLLNKISGLWSCLRTRDIGAHHAKPAEDGDKSSRTESSGSFVGFDSPYSTPRLFGSVAPLVAPLVIQAAANGDAGLIRRLGTDAATQRHPLPYSPPELGMTALLAGVLARDTAVVTAVLSIGADIDVRHDIMGWSALMYAVSHSDVAMVEHLLRAGANPRFEGADGLTAFDLAKGAAEESPEGRAIFQLMGDAGAIVATHNSLA